MKKNSITPDLILEEWLDQKYATVLDKLDHDQFSSEDMIILILKEQRELIKKLEEELKNSK